MRHDRSLAEGRGAWGRVAFVTPIAVFVLLLTSCAAPTASYTRFRSQAVSGRIVAAEEVRASEFINYHAQEDALPAPRTAVAERVGLAVEARLGDPAVPVSAAQPVLQVTLRGAAGAIRPPAHVVIAVDLSGSMNRGNKIGAVRHAVSRFVEALDPRDRISLVTFSHGANGIGPRTVGEQQFEILRAVASWQARGGTNLYAGLHEARVLAHNGRSGPGVTRIVLLSDGIPTAGTTDHRTILTLAQRCASEGISITAIGLGDEIDDRLLSGIARVSGGQYHYLDRPSEVERVFASEIRGLTEAAARDIGVRVQLPSGWMLVRSYADRTLTGPDYFVVPVGELAGNEAAVLLFELSAPAVHMGGAMERIMVSVALSSHSAPSSRVLATTSVDVTRTGRLPYDPAPGGAVLRNLMLGRAADALRMADQMRRAGQVESGVAALEAIIGDLQRARGRLANQGEVQLASSLEEPMVLLGRTLDTLRQQARRSAIPLGSSAWADWGPEAEIDEVACEIPSDCVPLPRSQ